MGIGKASVFKYIADYFPNDVGAVGGMVGLLGALGGFFLPPVFGAAGRWTGIPQMAFVALLVLTMGSLTWLHVTVIRLRSLAAAASRYGLNPVVQPTPLTLDPGAEQLHA
jgi:NNP family nitrate/nitrite transporter-like MFS transporter